MRWRNSFLDWLLKRKVTVRSGHQKDEKRETKQKKNWIRNGGEAHAVWWPSKAVAVAARFPIFSGFLWTVWKKLRGRPPYVDPLGYIGNQLEPFFTRQSYTFNDEPSSRVMKRITGQQLFSSMNYTNSIKQKTTYWLFGSLPLWFCCRCCNFGDNKMSRSWFVLLIFLFLFVFLLRRLFDQSHKSRIASYWGRGARCNYRTDGRLSCLALDYGGGPLVLGTETALSTTTTTWARPAPLLLLQESEGKQSGRGV